MLYHAITHKLGMNCGCFEFLWRHFHINEPEENEELEGDKESNNNDDDKEGVGLTFDRVQRKQQNNEAPEEEEEDEDKEVFPKKNVWYSKLSMLIDHVCEVSFACIYILGTILSFDEMMIRFCGRSVETHRMQNKPIREGYKFFVLATKLGYIVNFTPDGRTAEKKDLQEYKTDRSTGKIESMIIHVLSVLTKIKERQKERVRTHNRATRNNNTDRFDEDSMNNFCIAMDNYFTLPKILKKLRDWGIGVVGTSCFCINWPPKNLKTVEKKEAQFNDFFWTVDEHNTLVA